MMRLDLERAGLPYVDEGGLFADFHTHRHTFISNLGKAGVPLATAQKLARHSDPKLIANTYTHLGVSDKAAQSNCCPDSPREAALGEHSLRATETDSALPERTYGREKGEHQGEHTAGKSWQNVASGERISTKPSNQEDNPQTFTLARNEKSRRVVATPGEGVAEGTRTLDFWIHNPVPTKETPDENESSNKGDCRLKKSGLHHVHP